MKEEGNGEKEMIPLREGTRDKTTKQRSMEDVSSLVASSQRRSKRDLLFLLIIHDKVS